MCVCGYVFQNLVSVPWKGAKANKPGVSRFAGLLVQRHPLDPQVPLYSREVADWEYARA